MAEVRRANVPPFFLQVFRMDFKKLDGLTLEAIAEKMDCTKQGAWKRIHEFMSPERGRKPPRWFANRGEPPVRLTTQERALELMRPGGLWNARTVAAALGISTGNAAQTLLRLTVSHSVECVGLDNHRTKIYRVFRNDFKNSIYPNFLKINCEIKKKNERENC